MVLHVGVYLIENLFDVAHVYIDKHLPLNRNYVG